MGKKLLLIGSGVSLIATVGYSICLFLPLHKVYWKAGGFLDAVTMTIYSMSVHYNWKMTRACKIVRLFTSKKDLCDKDVDGESASSNEWLQDSSSLWCSDAIRPMIHGACEGMKHAYIMGILLLLFIIANFIMQGVGMFLIKEYLKKPKKQYREVAFFLDLIGGVLMLVSVILYWPITILQLDSMQVLANAGKAYPDEKGSGNLDLVRREAGDVGIYHVWPAQHKIWLVPMVTDSPPPGLQLSPKNDSPPGLKVPQKEVSFAKQGSLSSGHSSTLTMASVLSDDPGHLDGVQLSNASVDGLDLERAEWRIGQLSQKLRGCMGRALVSSPFTAAGLEDLRLMVFPEGKELTKGPRSKRQRELYAKKVNEGPLDGCLKIKVPSCPSETELQYFLKVGTSRKGPFRHNFAENTVSGCDDFGVDWLKQLEADGSLLVCVEFVKEAK